MSNKVNCKTCNTYEGTFQGFYSKKQNHFDMYCVGKCYDDAVYNDTKPNEYILLDDIDKTKDYQDYYCANIKENTFECSTQLTYTLKGGFGLNYRYCSNCYKKWNLLEQENRVNKYHASKKQFKIPVERKTQAFIDDPFDD